MVKCPRCGYENSRNSKYCVNCTYILKKDSKKNNKITSSGRSWGNTRTIKKIAIVLVIIIILLVSFSLLYQYSSTHQKGNYNVVSSDKVGAQYSTTPYAVSIEYDGRWTATLGDVNHLLNYSGTGSFDKRLDCVAWDHIIVKVNKDDGGTGPLIVHVYNEGKEIYTNTTTDEQGSIKFELNG